MFSELEVLDLAGKVQKLMTLLYVKDYYNFIIILKYNFII